jgi:acyl-coenzyme A thioesterase PaaI-like protein
MLIYRAETIVLPKTVTITVDYLRSAKARDTFVRANIVRQGRRVTAVHAQAWQDDESKPVARASANMLILGKT